ncbi:MAG: MFS transporter [Chloroflexi bacterium]|nr:MFS transporter [Chloroflexota bacterium]
MVPLLSRGVDHLGWRDVMLYAGIFVTVIVIPASLLIRRSPESMGIKLADYGEELESEPAGPVRSSGPQDAEATTGTDFTVGEALRTPVFWFIVFGSAFRISVTSGILVHAIPIMVWKGTSEQTGADVIALLFLISIPTRFLIGMSGVRFSGQYLLAAGMAIGAASLLGLIFVGGTWIVYVFVVGMALLEGAATLNWVVVGNFFGRTNFGTLTGIISIFYSSGMMLTPLFLGWMFDRTGSYTTSLLILAGLYGASAFLFSISRQPRLPSRANREMVKAGD